MCLSSNSSRTRSGSSGADPLSALLPFKLLTPFTTFHWSSSSSSSSKSLPLYRHGGTLSWSLSLCRPAEELTAAARGMRADEYSRAGPQSGLKWQAQDALLERAGRLSQTRLKAAFDQNDVSQVGLWQKG